jgi:hypothetical protein
MIMAIFFPFLERAVEVAIGISSKEEEVCSSYPEEEGRMTMATFLLS